MKLYELKGEFLRALEECVDEETGEITDTERLTALEMEWADKVDSICCYIKNELADAQAIKEEIDSLTKRMNEKKRKAERLTAYLETNLDGQEFWSPRACIKYRKSESLEIDLDKFRMNENACLYLKQADPVPDKVAIKKAIKDGTTFDGATIVTKMNMKLS